MSDEQVELAPSRAEANYTAEEMLQSYTGMSVSNRANEEGFQDSDVLVTFPLVRSLSRQPSADFERATGEEAPSAGLDEGRLPAEEGRHEEDPDRFGSSLSRQSSGRLDWATEEELDQNVESSNGFYPTSDFFQDPQTSPTPALSPSNAIVTGRQSDSNEAEETISEQLEVSIFSLPTGAPLGDARASAHIYATLYHSLQGSSTAATLARRMKEVTKYFFFNCVLQVLHDLVEQRVISSLRFSAGSPSLIFPFDVEGSDLMGCVDALMEDLKADPDLRSLSRLLALSSQPKKRTLYTVFKLVPQLLGCTRRRTNASRLFTLHVRDVSSLRATGSLSAIEAASAEYLLSSLVFWG
mmetsp:Transcript_19180/g.49142  ORF Transcript_19180/g.49142 Transcript_19180/m.49142 type:complete len:354 (-) Transcript_19180:1658-2719(-)